MSTKPKLLVVDNEIDIGNFVKSFFEVRGFEVMAVLNGDEAMKALDEMKPDLVSLDVMMRHEKEGLEYLPQIKKKMPNVRVIMVTGVDDKDTVEECKKMGADDYITKPLVLYYLESTLVDKVKHLSPATS